MHCCEVIREQGCAFASIVEQSITNAAVIICQRKESIASTPFSVDSWQHACRPACVSPVQHHCERQVRGSEVPHTLPVGASAPLAPFLKQKLCPVSMSLAHASLRA